MHTYEDLLATLPLEQQRIRARCYHPSGTFVPFPKDAIEQSIPQRFEQMVRLYPERLAIHEQEHIWSYTSLERYANQIANAILALNDTPHVPVALLFDHGAQVIAAMLGALKAGKIYVPLDAAYPAQRLSVMLEDATAPVLLTNTRTLTLARQLTGPAIRLLNLDTLPDDAPDQPPGIVVQPDDYAYIIYTSGSTGRPKGVVERHRNLLHHTMNYTNPCHFCPEDRLVQLLSCSFSGAVTPIYGALLNGAALFPYDLKQEGFAPLAAWLLAHEITVFIGGSAYRPFVNALSRDTSLPHLRLIYCGAEALYKHDVELYRQHFAPHCILINSLGATEMKIFRQYFIDQTTHIDMGNVPVGYAVLDNDVRIVDEHDNPLPPGQVGEIVIKSPYLAAGYWRQPELTRSRFLVDPAGSAARFYHTGDMGLLHPDGCLLHLGRRDFQLKIRGHRVEIGEIEARLLALPNIKETVVIATETPAQEPRLVGYIVPQGVPAPSVSQLRQMLAETLPAYMIPSVFVLLDRMPRTPNGKVDRSLLPPPETTRPALDVPFVMPRTPVEQRLSTLWSEVLGLDNVGVHDPFLDLGGHSLLATRLLSQIVQTFQVELPIRALLEAPTVAEMALIIADHQAQQADPATIAQILAEVEALSGPQAEPDTTT